MLMPSKVKFRKQQRGRMRGKAYRGSSLAFGDTGLQVLEPGWVTARQIEAARIAMTRAIKRGGKIWVRIFPDKPYTKKPAETRMGKGKGPPRAGSPSSSRAASYEMEGGTFRRPKEALGLAARQIGLKKKFVTLNRKRSSMKKKERETLAQQGVPELAEKEKQVKEASWKLRLQKATGQLENPMRLKTLRRDIARIKTYRRALEISTEKR